MNAREKVEKMRRQREFTTVFVNGKQKRVKRSPTIEEVSAEDFIRENADPIWLLQEGRYEDLYRWELERDGKRVKDEFGNGRPPAPPPGERGKDGPPF